MYDKEEKGVKPNTLRKISSFTPTKIKKLSDATHIRIRRGYTKRSYRPRYFS